MEYQSQMKKFRKFGEREKGYCRLYLDMGRTEQLRPVLDLPIWDKVKLYFSSLSKKAQIIRDKKTCKQFCSIYLYHRDLHNPECPAYRKSKGAILPRTKPDFEWPEEEDSDSVDISPIMWKIKEPENKPF